MQPIKINQIPKFIILIFFLTSFSINSIIAQTWNPVGSGTNGGIYALAVHKSNLYVGGLFTKAGGNSANNIAKWDGTKWSALGNGLNGTVLCLAEYNNELYAGGEFNRADGKIAHHIAKWDGTKWSAVGLGMDTIHNFSVYSLKVFKGELYAAGGFDYVIGTPNTQRMAKWNGTKWSEVGGGMDMAVGSLEIYNGKLYSLGPFTKAGGNTAKSAAKWNDTSWSAVGAGFNFLTIGTLKEFNNNLYAGGDFTMSGSDSMNYIAQWNGTKWSKVGKGFDNYVSALEVYNNELFAGGAFTKSNTTTLSNVAKWNGTNWIDIGGGMNNRVGEFVVYNSELYAAGNFTMASGNSANYIAKLSSKSGIKENKLNTAISIFPNPTNGAFQLTIPENNHGELQIFDIYGKCVFQSLIVSPTTVFNLSKELKGVYFYYIKIENELTNKGKLIFQ